MGAFHEGELQVQERAGVREKVAAAGDRMIRSFMPEQHREFFAKLPAMLLGALDAQRRPWASIVAGRPGFVETPDERHLRIAATLGAGDPLAGRIAEGMPIGLLGIEPHTRRRNRMNGTVVAVDDASFTVEVDQSFGNCPKYIQAREPRWCPAEPGDAPAHRRMDATLDGDALALAGHSDTLFIASASPQARGSAGFDGVDVSHRGGRPGFVHVAEVSGQSVLTLPDFRGNNMFNTLGNIAANPRAGMLFVDYETGDLLQLTGEAHIVWEGKELAAFRGAQRLLRLVVEEAVWRPAALPLRWTPPLYADQLAETGIWSELAA